MFVSGDEIVSEHVEEIVIRISRDVVILILISVAMINGDRGGRIEAHAIGRAFNLGVLATERGIPRDGRAFFDVLPHRFTGLRRAQRPVRVIQQGDETV